MQSEKRNEVEILGKYIIKRLLIMIPTLLAVIFIVLGILELTPGSPAQAILGFDAKIEAVEELNIKLGYDKPFWERYTIYVANLLHGDMGISYRTSRPVLDEIMARFPTSLKLAGIAIVIAILIGVPIGILSAIRQYSIWDFLSTSIAMFFASMPGFWFGLMAVIIFSLKLGWLPPNGMDSWKSYIMPCLTLALPATAALLRLTRTTMLETIRQDYIRTARAKGEIERKVIINHALKNALLPVVTYCGVEFGLLMGGIVTVETIFSIHGLGNLILTAIRTKDVTLITGCAVFLALAFMTVLLLVDILYAYIDPRIRMRYSKKS